MPARCGASISPRGRCARSPRRSVRTRACSRAGTARRSPGVCSSRPRPSRQASAPARTRMRTSISRSHNSTRPWARRGLASVLALAAAACPRPQGAPTPLTPGVEPELRVGLACGAGSVTRGGEGELFVRDAGNGEPLGSVPAGASWTIVPDTGGLHVVRPDGSRSARHVGISAVNVTERRFAMAAGRRYRGRVNVVRDPSGLTVLNRVPVESYLAGVLAGEIGVRRNDEEQALLAQAVVSRSFALKNRGRWEAFGFDAWADVRDQLYNGVSGETPEVWSAIRRTGGQVLEYDGAIIEAYFHSTCGGTTAAVEEAFKTAQDRPYLRPVSDASGRGRAYCDLSPRFRWREEWDGTKLRAILSRTLPAGMHRGGDGFQSVSDILVSHTGPSGRFSELLIVFEHRVVLLAGPCVLGVLRADAASTCRSMEFVYSQG